MSTEDFVWGMLILINFFGFFIPTEPLPWLYKFRKWAYQQFPIGNIVLFFDKTDVLFFVVITILLLAKNGFAIKSAVLILFLIYTASAVFKIVNAFLPPQHVIQEITTVKDTVIFWRGGHIPKTFILVKVELAGLGERVLPACPYDIAFPYHQLVGRRIAVHCRLGGLGLLYRFSFTRCCWY